MRRPLEHFVRVVLPITLFLSASAQTILPPGADSGTGVESEEDRRQRLLGAGVLTPTPTPEPKQNWFEKKLQGLAAPGQKKESEAKKGKGLEAPKAVTLRMGSTLGSWFSLKAPRDTRYTPDFSWSAWALMALPPPSSPPPEGTLRQRWLGMEWLSLGGVATLNLTGVTADTAKVSADWSSFEPGLLYGESWEKEKGGPLSTGWEWRARYAPYRFVKAQVQGDRLGDGPGKRSDGRSHNTLNLYGLSLMASAHGTFGRWLMGGFFAELGLAHPYEARLRVGVALGLGAPEEEPPHAPSDPTATPSAGPSGT